MPGFTIADEYTRRCGAEVVFIGARYGLEQRLVPEYGYPLYTLPAAPWARQGAGGKLRSAVEAAQGLAAARRLLGQLRPDLVLGLGGYVSAGPVLAARLLGIPAVIHEANVVPGAANRWLANAATRVLTGWRETPPFRGGQRNTRFTGVPTGPGTAPERSGAGRRVLVAGGSEGSAFLNRHAPAMLARVPEAVVRHQTGSGGAQAVRQAYAAAGVQALVEEFIADMSEAYAGSDLAITTAGAITLMELARTATPALLVPLGTAANGHQEWNAEAFARAAGAPIVTETEWDEGVVAAQVAALLADRRALDELGRKTRAVGEPEAAARIVAECEEVLGGAR